MAPDTPGDGVGSIVARLRGAVDADPVPVADEALAVSVSAGAATWSDGDDAEALVRRAEHALAAGRVARGDVPADMG